MPLLPLQILWMNLLQMSFRRWHWAVEPTAPGNMQRPPRSRRSTYLLSLLSNCVTGNAGRFNHACSVQALAAMVPGLIRKR